MIKLDMAHSNKNKQTFAIQQADYIDARVLVAGVAESQAVPTGAKYVIINSIDDNGASIGIYCLMDGTAVIPSTDVTDGTASEINPGIRYISGVSTISVISPVACVVTFMFYN